MAKKNINSDATVSEENAPQYMTLPALPKLSWEEWASVNMDEFRTLFPQFRQVEQTAIPQILTNFYKDTTPDLGFYNSLVLALQANKMPGENQAQRATQRNYVDNMDKILWVYETLKNDTELNSKVQEWAQKVKQSQVVVKHATPTVLAKKHK